MKKSLFLLPIFISFFVMVFSVKVSAAVDLTSYNEYLNDYFQANVTITEYSYNEMIEYWEFYPDRPYWCTYNSSYNRFYPAILNGSWTISNNNIIYNGGYTVFYSDQTSGNFSSSSGSVNYPMSSSVYFENYQAFLNNFVNIDFDNIYYSPTIPVPDIDVIYLRQFNTPQSGVAYWLANLLIYDNIDYYVQYGYKISVPTQVGIGINSSTGTYVYDYDLYNTGSYIDIKTLQDMTVCQEQSLSSSDIVDAWQSAYDNLIDAGVPLFYPKLQYWVDNPNNSKYLQAQEYYKDNMMNIIPMYGNRLEFFVRYFTVQDEKVYVGDWVHWSSDSGSKTQDPPENYVDQTSLPGTVNTSNDVDMPSSDNTYTNIGTPVGNQPTIINNNYAPNYPDYPTVATYNHDNILLNFMDTARQLPSFFGEFTDFLTVSFTFIPSWIWVIIGTGFTFSIVIMIIKVL